MAKRKTAKKSTEMTREQMMDYLVELLESKIDSKFEHWFNKQVWPDLSQVWPDSDHRHITLVSKRKKSRFQVVLWDIKDIIDEALEELEEEGEQ